jgi:hypothetical protein
MDADLTLDYSDPEDNNINDRARIMNVSEMNLARNLELARRNSRNQRHEFPRGSYDGPVEESIYEGMSLAALPAECISLITICRGTPCADSSCFPGVLLLLRWRTCLIKLQYASSFSPDNSNSYIRLSLH